MPVTVYFEAKTGAHMVAQFDEEETYMACLPPLEALAESKGYIVTESLSEQKTNHEKAAEIYECRGQSAVFDAVLNGKLTATSWHWCVPCECVSPHEDDDCLVCGTKNDPEELKAKIAELLEDNHPAELERLTGIDGVVCRKIVHELYPKDKNCWSPEGIGDGSWGIYGKNFAGEWIDKNGDYLCFDSKAEANQYIKETMK